MTPSRRSVTLAARVLALVAAAGVFATAAATPRAIGDDEPRLVTAMFADASPILEGNDVLMDGVPVGKVRSMTVVGNQSAVTVALEPEAMPVHRDARMTIKPVSLLGERFIEYDRGSPQAPLLGPDEPLPVEQTGRPSDLDQLLNAINDPTGRALAGLVTTLGDGMRDNGKNADEAVKALAPAMTDTENLVRVLNDQSATLQQLVDNTEPVAGALAADDGKRLDGLVDSANQLLGTTADRQKALNETLVRAPDTLAQTRGALEDLAGVTRSATPTLRSMRPTTDNLVAISAELQTFADSADPALASSQPVLDRARELLAEARPVVSDLKPAGPDLRGTAAGLDPLANEFTDRLPGFWNFIQGWALTTNGYDGLSHYFRAMVTVNTDEITHAVPPAAPLLDGNQPPDAATPGPAPLPQIPGVSPEGAPLPGLLEPGPSADGGATGLDEKQESGALDYLLGGN
ncbi:MlaD family protein [Pseudonocardia endophytica]|uniref:Phospholipid/cholesterol/gamma-HCH transport system substrate-binding protein n=1 Tax=Pseudonocardia endophytica TaxID=401976 RepID=A0A4R1I817_PSEEN|nr:MlaD family protein [Pseudonocardia endophytica]TCK26282.1 phospholipid/cholesterol/gamma-HCH transport system substrate-binding protein [Pseudonocardia endophytica]